VDLSKDSENYQAYLWFSPMGVKSFEDRKKELQEAQHICIGKTTASALERIVENKFNIWYPSSPSVELMVDQVLHLYS
jgi:uroporphyrinogen-III synthase